MMSVALSLSLSGVQLQGMFVANSCLIYRNYLTVVNVAAIQEKVFYLAGNKKRICVCRAPNFVEKE